MPLVSSGVEHGNLRELALARMKDMGTEVRLEHPLALDRKMRRQLVLSVDGLSPAGMLSKKPVAVAADK